MFIIKSYRKTAKLVSAILLVQSMAFAGDLLNCVDGNAVEGEIKSVFGASVRMVTSTDEDVEVELSQLTAESVALLNKWKADNEHLVDVYKEFDKSPAPRKTNNPSLFLSTARQREKGMVAVDIVIDRKGNVMWSEVVKTSNTKLNDASIDAISKWKFDPAIVGGESVRAKIRIRLRF